MTAIIDQGETDGSAWVRYSSPRPVRSVYFVYTQDEGDWPLREWKQTLAAIVGDRATFTIPAQTTAWYFNILDDRGCTVSSGLVTPNTPK